MREGFRGDAVADTAFRLPSGQVFGHVFSQQHTLNTPSAFTRPVTVTPEADAAHPRASPLVRVPAPIVTRSDHTQQPRPMTPPPQAQAGPFEDELPGGAHTELPSLLIPAPPSFTAMRAAVIPLLPIVTVRTNVAGQRLRLPPSERVEERAPTDRTGRHPKSRASVCKKF